MIEIITNLHSKEVGSCNACSRYATASGSQPHFVTQVNLRTLAFRLCDPCRDELVRDLIGHDASQYRIRPSPPDGDDVDSCDRPEGQWDKKPSHVEPAFAVADWTIMEDKEPSPLEPIFTRLANLELFIFGKSDNRWQKMSKLSDGTLVGHCGSLMRVIDPVSFLPISPGYHEITPADRPGCFLGRVGGNVVGFELASEVYFSNLKKSDKITTLPGEE